jgi:hypothetical protein
MSVDIVNLIESNPITKLSGDYQSKLVEKVKNSFTNYEQQLFLSSFYCYLKYDTKNDFVIDLDNIWQWLGFSQKIKAKILLENNFKIDINYKKLLSREGKQDEKTHGGHNKETFMLNIETFKKFCLKTGTKKADEIHDYFIKLENVMFEITKEESEELKKQILKLENTNKEMEKYVMKEKEKVLLDKFSTSGPLVYIIKVKTYKSGEYVVKIGHSLKGVLDRYNEHKTKFDECLLLDCFSCDKSKDLESFIHHHKNIQSNKVTDLPRHTSDKELFLIGKDLSYQTLLKIIDNNISNYNYRVKELLLEIENLKLKNNGETINNDNELLKELVQTNKMLTNKIISLENSIHLILNKLNEKETKVVTGFNQQLPNLGPRLQKINPETLQLVKVYESVTEAMNENKNIKRPTITNAVKENTIYCGFRWQLVERNLDANIIHSLAPTKETKVQNLGYIAKLDANKSQIINVYLDRKSSANRNNYPSDSSLDYFVKNGTITNGYYYMLYDNCEQSLIDIFEELYGETLLYKNGVGQYDLNNNLTHEFSCKYDCIKELKMSDKTLAKALKNNTPYNNYYYKELGEKISIL